MKKRISISLLTLILVLSIATIGWAVVNNKPVAVIDSTPNSSTIILGSPLTLNHTNSTDPDGDEIINVEYEVKMRVQDKNGEWSEWTNKKFNSENIKVALTSPQQNTTYTTAPINFTADVAAYGQVTKVEFYVNGNKIGEDLSAPYSYSWNVPYGNNGFKSAYAKVVMADGKSAISSLTSFDIDVTYSKTVYASADGYTWEEFDGVSDWGGFDGTSSSIGMVFVGTSDTHTICAPIIKYDLSGIPTGAKVISAKIILSHDISELASRTLKVISNWDDSNSPLGQIVDFDSQQGIYPFVNSSLVESWINGSTPNYGIMVQPAYDGTYGSYWFYSKERQGQEHGPKLLIQYK